MTDPAVDLVRSDINRAVELIELAGDLAKKYIYNLDCDRDRCSGRAGPGTLQLARDLGRGIEEAIDQARAVGLVSHIPVLAGCDMGRVGDVARSISTDKDLNFIHANARTLVASNDFASVRRLARDLATVHDAMETKADQGPHVSKASQRIASWATLALQAEHRLLYAEIFQSELYEVAQQGRWAQIGYAMRVLVTAPRLRRDLRIPGPPKRERSW